jgi:anti-sigma factor RsiW
MLCADFEDRLTDYLEGTLDAGGNRAFAEHALRCPVCHELLNEVRNALELCRTATDVPPPSIEMEARILSRTMPEAAMTCQEFEEHLTDYLDGFLPATLFHRWERHAALCENCTQLPGQVVRAIGACYTHISEELPVPVGLHERILQATIGTTAAEEVRAPLGARIAARLRLWLDPIVSPQLASVATMLLVAVMVLTSTVSADGSIRGLYSASVQLAEKTYTGGANGPVKPVGGTIDFKQVAEGVRAVMHGRVDSSSSNGTQKQDGASQEKAPEQQNR